MFSCEMICIKMNFQMHYLLNLEGVNGDLAFITFYDCYKHSFRGRLQNYKNLHALHTCLMAKF